MRLTLPLNLPAGTGQASAPILQISLSQVPVFVVNSRLGLSSAAGPRSAREGLHACRLSFSRGYGHVLPSSLTRVFPRTLGFSPRLPVSVCGTGTSSLTRGFSRRHGSSGFALPRREALPVRPRPFRGGFSSRSALSLRRALPVARPDCLPRHPIAQSV